MAGLLYQEDSGPPPSYIGSSPLEMAAQSSTTALPLRSDRKRPKSRKELKQTIKDLRAEQTRLVTEFEEMKEATEQLRQKALFSEGFDVAGESSAEKLSRLLTVNVLKKTLEQKEREFQRQLSVREEEIKQLRDTKGELLETEEMDRLEPGDFRSEELLGSQDTQGDELPPSVALQTDFQQCCSTEMTQTSFLEDRRTESTHTAVQTEHSRGVQAGIQTEIQKRQEREVQTERLSAQRFLPKAKLLQLSHTTLESTQTPTHTGSLSSTAKGYRSLYEEKCGECESLRLLLHKQTPTSQSYSELPISFDTVLSPIRRPARDSPVSALDLTIEVKEAKLRAKDAALSFLSDELRKREKQVVALEQTSLKSGSVRLRRLAGP